jgi:hypothetical protein
MERYKPNRPTSKSPIKKYQAWHAPTIKNVCRLRARMERLQEECDKVRRLISRAPELAALYSEMEGPISPIFMPRPPEGKPRLVVDNTPRTRAPTRSKHSGGPPEAA